MIPRVTFEGRLGQDPEIRRTPNSQVATLRLACTDRINVKGEEKELTEWVTVVAWGKLADLAAHLHKGDSVGGMGRLQTRSWEDKNGGGKRYATEVRADWLGTSAPFWEASRTRQEPAPAQGGDDGPELPF